MTAAAKILIVDDDESARDVVADLLGREPFQYEFAVDGRAAVARLDSQPVDLVLCDVMMPGLDGFDVCKQVKAHPRWRYVPLILVTALDDHDDMNRGIEAGADDFLSKPIDMVVLRARVHAMLRVREHYRQLERAASDLDSLLRARRNRIAASAGLSAREREVLDLLLLGRNYDDIGALLGMSARTAKYHQANILVKLGADSRVDLARIFL